MNNKHYIRLDGNKVVKCFSDAFEQPQDGDICINQNGGRHFELNGVFNPTLFDGEVYLYKHVNGEIISLSLEEITQSRPIPQPKIITDEEKAMDLIKVIALNIMNNDELLKVVGIEPRPTTV